MMMKKNLSIFIGVFLLAAGTVHSATITVAASGGADHTTISDAVAAAAGPSDTIQITEANTYPGTLTIPGGQTLIIENTSGGTVTAIGAGLSGGWTVDPTTGNVDVTIRNIDLFRDTGTGPVFDIDQHATNTVNVTFDNVNLVSEAADPLKIDDGAGAGGGQVTVVATNTTFDSSNTPADRSGIRMASEAAIYDNVSVTLTDCVINANTIVGGAAIRIDAMAGQTGHTWVLDGCTLNAPLDRGFEVDDALINSSFTIQDSTITCEEEAILFDEIGTNNAFVVKRNTLDNSGGALGDYTVSIRFNSGSGNTADFFNNIIIAQGATGRALYVGEGGVHRILHNTLVGTDTGTGSDIGVAIVTAPDSFEMSNNIFVNLGNPFSGSTGTATLISGNLIAGANDDSSVGGGRIFCTLGELNLDGSYAPQDPSTAHGAGDPDSGIATLVENVDNLGGSRPVPVATNPDIGAIETASVPVDLSTFGLE